MRGGVGLEGEGWGVGVGSDLSPVVKLTAVSHCSVRGGLPDRFNFSDRLFCPAG